MADPEMFSEQDSQLLIELTYLRGALQAREEELVRLRADRVVEQAQADALLRLITELNVKIVTLSSAVTVLMSDAEMQHVVDMRQHVLS